MKILAVCQNGLGSSFIVQMNIQNILKEENVDTSNISVDHADVGSTGADSADYFFTDKTLADNLNVPKDKVIPLNSLIEKEETKKDINKILKKENIDFDAN